MLRFARHRLSPLTVTWPSTSFGLANQLWAVPFTFHLLLYGAASSCQFAKLCQPLPFCHFCISNFVVVADVMNSSCQDMDAVDPHWKWDALIWAISVTNICPAVTLLLQLTPVLTGTVNEKPLLFENSLLELHFILDLFYFLPRF